MSPTGNTYSSDQSVTITCTTSSAEIRYTTDGTDPRTNPYSVYLGPILVTGPGTSTIITAYSVKSGMIDSTIRTEVYSIVDITAPVPGNGGTITASNVKMTAITLNWTKATDDTPQASLQYLVYQSLNNDMDTVANIQAHGSPVNGMTWTADIDTINVIGLTLDTVYYFNVIVRDQAGNMSAYASVSQKSLADLSTYVAFYPFSGDSNDGSGYGNNLTASGGPTLTTNRAATVNRAYSLNGTSQYLRKLNPSGYSETGEVTASVWIYQTSVSADQKVFGHFNDICTRGWAIGIVSGLLQVDLDNGAEYKLAQGSVPTNTWTHLALTWKAGGTLKGYVNGIKVSESGVTGTSALSIGGTHYFKVGAEPWSTSTLFFGGKIDDIRVYTKEMGPMDVLALYNLAAD